jgi:formylglycine-generating enzyme required for sulfatase activity
VLKATEQYPATVSTFRLDKYDVTVGRLRQYVDYLAKGGALPEEGSGKHAHLNGGKGLVNGASELPDAGPLTYETGWDSADWDTYIPTGSAAASVWNRNLSNDGGCQQEEIGEGNTFSTWTNAPAKNEDLPVNCVNWWESYAFCIWDGGFLPSEAEWEYASAGGGQQRDYPWGATDPGTSSRYAVYNCLYPHGSTLTCTTCSVCTGITNIAPVGAASLGGGRWGQLDLEGNMQQWTLDSYAPPYIEPCKDCAYLGVASPITREYRGIAFDMAIEPLLSRTNDLPSRRLSGLGFRCARAP